jgi:putative endopeptidase
MLDRGSLGVAESPAPAEVLSAIWKLPMRISDNFTRVFLPLIVFSLVSVAFSQESAQNRHATHGIQIANIDRSVNPGDNFFLYANGEWIQRTTIPNDRAAVGVFTTLDDLANKRTGELIQEVSKANGAAGSPQRKIADLYNSYMDEKAIESKGLAPIKPHLDKIAAIRDKKELAFALGASMRADVDALNNTNFHTPNLFGLWAAPDFNDSMHYTAYLLQGGLQLPDREYYLSDSEQMKKTREEYQKHVTAMLKLAGFTDADSRAARIIELERKIAEKHIRLADDEDIHKADNPWNRSDFGIKAPGLDWSEFFRGADLSQQEKFIVWQPTAFAGESQLVASESLDTWKDWLAFHLVEFYASVLPKALDDEQFAFFGKALYEVPQQRPRWERAVFIVNELLGDDVGRIYAQRYFSPEAKAQGEAMVRNIIEAFRKRIDALTWMNPATKSEAKAKLSALYVGIGYPETWHDYFGLEIRPDEIFGNIWRGSLFQYHYALSRLGKNVDRKEWSMTPQTVNAVNLPLQIALNFPAAILQPPFFDPKAPSVVNYGAIGSIIGHEISHTFDTEGSTFDATGMLRNWWTPEDLRHFDEATAKLVAQCDAYKPFPDLHVNGKQTIAENIADLGGILASYDGYRASLGRKEASKQDGFTGDQQFFIAFGQNWAAKERPAALRQQVLTDEHSPAEYRADTVRNVDAWYAAFDVAAGRTLYLTPEERVRIW